MTLAHICGGRGATLSGATARRLLHLGLVLAVSLLATPAAGQGAAETVATEGSLTIEMHKGRLIRLPRPAAAVFVADPEVADVQAHSPTLVYVFGRAQRNHHLYAVDENEEVLLRRERGGRAPPVRAAAGDPRARARPAGSRSARSTAASSSTARSRRPLKAQELREIAERYLGENETLINRVTRRGADPGQSPGPGRRGLARRHQAVRHQLGGHLQPGDFLFGLATGRAVHHGRRPPFLRASDAGGSPTPCPATTPTATSRQRRSIDALSARRPGQRPGRAQPDRALGRDRELPRRRRVPGPGRQDDNNSIEIQFKQFGVSLAFTPTVLSAGRISMRGPPRGQRPQRQGRDQAQRPGHPRPVTRRAETTVELGSGQLRDRRPDLEQHTQNLRQGAGPRRPAGARHAVPLAALPGAQPGINRYRRRRGNPCNPAPSCLNRSQGISAVIGPVCHPSVTPEGRT